MWIFSARTLQCDWGLTCGAWRVVHHVSNTPAAHPERSWWFKATVCTIPQKHTRLWVRSFEVQCALIVAKLCASRFSYHTSVFMTLELFCCKESKLKLRCWRATARCNACQLSCSSGAPMMSSPACAGVVWPVAAEPHSAHWCVMFMDGCAGCCLPSGVGVLHTVSMRTDTESVTLLVSCRRA